MADVQGEKHTVEGWLLVAENALRQAATEALQSTMPLVLSTKDVHDVLGVLNGLDSILFRAKLGRHKGVVR